MITELIITFREHPILLSLILAIMVYNLIRDFILIQVRKKAAKDYKQELINSELRVEELFTQLQSNREELHKNLDDIIQSDLFKPDSPSDPQPPTDNSTK